MEKINTAAVFEDVSDSLNVRIPHLMARRSVLGTVIDKKAYREFEWNKLVGTLFPEGERHPGFQVMAAQRNQLVSIFGSLGRTRDSLNVAEEARWNDSLER